MTMKLHIAHLHAQDVASRSFAAHWSENNIHNRQHLVKEARDNLIQLLASEPAGTRKDTCREALVDLIAMAIVNSNDIDATPEGQAEAILEDILNNCLPMPETKS